MRVRTSQPNPEYLHISLLTVFTGQAWTPGGRDLPARQAADGAFPDPNGMSDTVPRTTVEWDVEIMDNFRSLWLPTPEYVASMNAGEDWRYDSETLDVSAAARRHRHRRHVLLRVLAGAAVQRAGDGRRGRTAGRHRRAVHRAARRVPAERARPGRPRSPPGSRPTTRRPSRSSSSSAATASSSYTTDPPPGNSVQDLVLVPRRGRPDARATASSSPPRWRRWPAASTSRPGSSSASSAASRWRRTSGSTPPATCTPGPSSTSRTPAG